MLQRSIRSSRRSRTLVATAAAVAVSALFAPAAQAVDLLVTSKADGPPDGCDANCTLRDAIEVARSNYTTYTIKFAPNVMGTIRLTQGPLSFVNSNDEHRPLTIKGPGADALAISGDANGDGTANSGDVRVLDIDSKR